MKIVDLNEKFISLKAKIDKIEDALKNILEDENEIDEELTVTEFEIIENISNVHQGFNDVIMNYNEIKKCEANGDFDEVNDTTVMRINEGFVLSMNMVDFYLTKLAKRLEIGA